MQAFIYRGEKKKKSDTLSLPNESESFPYPHEQKSRLRTTRKFIENVRFCRILFSCFFKFFLGASNDHSLCRADRVSNAMNKVWKNVSS